MVSLFFRYSLILKTTLHVINKGVHVINRGVGVVFDFDKKTPITFALQFTNLNKILSVLKNTGRIIF